MGIHAAYARHLEFFYRLDEIIVYRAVEVIVKFLSGFRMELEYKYGKLNQETQTKIVTEQMKQNSETTRQELKANEDMKQEILNMAKEGLNDSI